MRLNPCDIVDGIQVTESFPVDDTGGDAPDMGVAKVRPMAARAKAGNEGRATGDVHPARPPVLRGCEGKRGAVANEDADIIPVQEGKVAGNDYHVFILGRKESRDR
jgi:hypothetical protein